MSVLIGISGKAQHGKDTVCEFVCELLEPAGYRVVRLSFADALKEECRTQYGWDGLKDTAGRALLQQVGIARRKENINYWVSKVFDQISHNDLLNPKIVFVVPDVRFLNEATAIRTRHGVLWRVVRWDADGMPFDNGLTPAQNQHPSETELDYYQFDKVFVNAASLAELRLHVKWKLEAMELL